MVPNHYHLVCKFHDGSSSRFPIILLTNKKRHEKQKHAGRFEVGRIVEATTTFNRGTLSSTPNDTQSDFFNLFDVIYEIVWCNRVHVIHSMPCLPPGEKVSLSAFTASHVSENVTQS